MFLSCPIEPSDFKAGDIPSPVLKMVKEGAPLWMVWFNGADPGFFAPEHVCQHVVRKLNVVLIDAKSQWDPGPVIFDGHEDVLNVLAEV